MQTGPLNLITDVAGLKVGNAQDDTLKSGSTVLCADAPFTASVHVMGGAPGTRETDLLAPDKTVAAVDALVLSGGSAFGLDACSGVMDALYADGRGYAVGDARVPLVPGAILFDLLNGGDKNWAGNPYRSLGKEAYANASTSFTLGSVGAGTGALTGREKGGLGSASMVIKGASGPFTVGALVAANPVGSATVPEGPHFWAAPFEIDSEFGGLGMETEAQVHGLFQSHKLTPPDARGNTTIAIVATDAPLSKPQCHRMAVAAHDGIARAIVPAHSPFDGDLVFGVSTGHEKSASLDDMALFEIGQAAALCLSRAIARAVYEAKPAAGDVLPAWQSRTGV